MIESSNSRRKELTLESLDGQDIIICKLWGETADLVVPPIDSIITATCVQVAVWKGTVSLNSTNLTKLKVNNALILKTHDNIPLKHWNWQFTHFKRWYNAYYDLEPYICSFCILTHNMIQQTSDYVCFYCNAGNRWRDTISRWNRRVGNPWVSSNNNINIHALYYFLSPALRAPYNNHFGHLSVLLRICSLPLAQSDRVPLHKAFAVTLNEVCMSGINIISHYFKSFFHSIYTLYLALFGSLFTWRNL